MSLKLNLIKMLVLFCGSKSEWNALLITDISYGTVRIIIPAISQSKINGSHNCHNYPFGPIGDYIY